MCCIKERFGKGVLQQGGVTVSVFCSAVRGCCSTVKRCCSKEVAQLGGVAVSGCCSKGCFSKGCYSKGVFQ